MMRALRVSTSSVSSADVRVVYRRKSSQLALSEMAVSLHLQHQAHAAAVRVSPLHSKCRPGPHAAVSTC